MSSSNRWNEARFGNYLGTLSSVPIQPPLPRACAAAGGDSASGLVECCYGLLGIYYVA